jgi:hypothetical protein
MPSWHCALNTQKMPYQLGIGGITESPIANREHTFSPANSQRAPHAHAP